MSDTAPTTDIGMSSGVTSPSTIHRMAAWTPFLTIAVPTLNEAEYIEGCLASLVRQWPASDCEILVLDGGSTDGTQALVEAFSQRFAPPGYPTVRLLHNPRRIQSAAMNLAASLASARSKIMVRADAHAVYPADFVRSCVSALLSQGATSVVVPMRNEAQPAHGLQRAIAAAQSSRVGNGGAAHRGNAASAFVDHGHHAVFDLAFFRSIGGYDQSFTHNEDAEYDLRVARAGGRIWMNGAAPVVYYPRKQLDALARQYFRHGGGRARTLLKHGVRPRLRQMAPLAVLGASVAAVASAPFAPTLAAGALVYPAACLGWAATTAARRRDPWLLAGAPALIVMHMAWAAGFVATVLKARRRRFDATSVGLTGGAFSPPPAHREPG